MPSRWPPGPKQSASLEPNRVTIRYASAGGSGGVSCRSSCGSFSLSPFGQRAWIRRCPLPSRAIQKNWDPRSRTLGAWDPKSRFGCRRSEARFRNAAGCLWFPTTSFAGHAEKAHRSCEAWKAPHRKAPPGRGLSRDETWGSSETHGVGVCSERCRN
jgi:hypothetical protein